MDTTTADDISRLLNQYRTAIHEMRDHASERCSFGRFRAGAPYFARHALQLLQVHTGTAHCSRLLLKKNLNVSMQTLHSLSTRAAERIGRNSFAILLRIPKPSGRYFVIVNWVCVIPTGSIMCGKRSQSFSMNWKGNFVRILSGHLSQALMKQVSLYVKLILQSPNVPKRPHRPVSSIQFLPAR